jgi:hypothetical protein
MYTIYILWLILAALILLLAMVGSIVITIKPHSSSSEEAPIAAGNRNIILQASVGGFTLFCGGSFVICGTLIDTISFSDGNKLVSITKYQFPTEAIESTKVVAESTINNISTVVSNNLPPALSKLNLLNPLENFTGAAGAFDSASAAATQNIIDRLSNIPSLSSSPNYDYLIRNIHELLQIDYCFIVPMVGSIVGFLAYQKNEEILSLIENIRDKVLSLIDNIRDEILS